MLRSVPGRPRWHGSALLTAALIASALMHSLPSLAASAPGLNLPALAAPATQVRQPGRIVWHDLLTPDLAVDERFYAGLFDWSFQEMQPAGRSGRYAVAFAGGIPVAGLLERPLPRAGGRRPQWLGFFSSDDVDAAMRAALQHGGRARSAVHDYPQRGRQVVLQDPQGVVFGVVSSSSGDPPDVLAEPGQWIWSALFAPDAGDEAAFYQNVFGYDVYDLNDASDVAQATTQPNAQPSAQASTTDSNAAALAASSGTVEHLELASGGYARATINGLPATGQQHAHWLNFVRVGDVFTAASRAQSLGARVVLAPRPDRRGGHIAVLADPSGALVGIMDWSDTDEANGVGTGPAAQSPAQAPPASAPAGPQ